MRLYIELYFHSDGTNPLDILDMMKDLGLNPVVGKYDFAKDYETPEEYEEIINDLSESLKSTGVTYSLTTKKK